MTVSLKLRNHVRPLSLPCFRMSIVLYRFVCLCKKHSLTTMQSSTRKQRRPALSHLIRSKTHAHLTYQVHTPSDTVRASRSRHFTSFSFRGWGLQPEPITKPLIPNLVIYPAPPRNLVPPLPFSAVYQNQYPIEHPTSKRNMNKYRVHL